ncbi:YciI family protein [Paraburkholderia bryophila]|uniref:YciI family protein n=1 Tax=Burkholderiaceae TaxID=119060 RepID=UPI00055149A4|nr:YciI family protein [Burkholderia sp. 9120]
MYLIVSQYVVEPAKVDPHRKSHSEWVAKYIGDGTFIAAGPRESKTGGVIIAKGIDQTTLNTILAEDSFVVQKLVEIEIVGFDPVFAAEQFLALKEQ